MFDLARLPRSAFLPALQVNLQGRMSPKKLYRHFLVAVRMFLEADTAWLMRGIRRDRSIKERHILGNRNLVREDLAVEFAAQRSPRLPKQILLAPLRVRGSLVAVIGAARKQRPFGHGAGHDLNRLAAALAEELTRRHEERLDRVLERIKEKVVQELRPRDLSYQILSGLHELVQFDHSAALLDYDPASGKLKVEAEKIVWTKTKSAFIGHEIPVEESALRSLTRREEPRVLCGSSVKASSDAESHEAGAHADDDDARLLDLLSYHKVHRLPAATSVIAAPLMFDHELLGVLKIAGRNRNGFDASDLDIVTRFLPMAATALRNARVTLNLEDQVVDAELRAGLATLARAVAHDVNNAIGAILPLAQQIRAELQEGTADPRDLIYDLETIIDKTRLCQRIFGNMLRTGVRRSGTGPIHLNQIVREMLPMLESQVSERPIELVAELAPSLPVIDGPKHELEHVVWNLVTNSADALGNEPGRIELLTTPVGHEALEQPSDATAVALEVRDNGPGMDAELLAKVHEPFFTTKAGGTGLGLPICRSLVWQLGGTMKVRSEPGQGTAVVVELPVAELQPEP